ncbi:hypothetical protein EFK50_16780 [Nocardioides marmoriginsengisoli]|uniref:Flagellar hook-associated protein 2 n=1 Tax=Nocardioides marmoriginsengisoli TaxID=661483 RepID=A0A3N0CCK9_9ACTN|nr:flagellar filament capping protein FliD [Nocardioides marmoriginsengisoli]RNL61039.1 hypothetical protein EFK50_16780 [Nocardioides marmoriginsengisoli]
MSGLVSGLNTSTIISQLMQVEAQTQTSIKAKVTTEQANVKALQDLNSAFAALATSTAALAKATAWNPVTVTSSNPLVSATAGASTVTGPLSITVGHTAATHRLTYAGTAALTDTVTTGSTSVRLDNLDGTTTTVDTGDGTLAGLVRGLNASGTGVKASTVRLDDGSYRLQVTSVATGAAADFTLTNLDGSDLLGGATVRAGRDAEITLGTDTIHSASNTFTDVANGLTITLGAGVADGATVDLDVVQDTAGMTKTVQGIVDSINAALTKIDSLTSYNAATKTAGPLAGDSSIRALRNDLLTSIYPSDGTTMAGAGVQLDRYGKFTFDADKFKAAYAADPGAVAAKFTSGAVTGFADRVQQVAKSASDSISGTVTTSINGRNTSIKRMQDSIASWDIRLELRQETLTRQFTAMETALQQMNSQSSWLTSQLSSLSSGS